MDDERETLTPEADALAAAVADHLSSPDTDKLHAALQRYRQAREWS